MIGFKFVGKDQDLEKSALNRADELKSTSRNDLENTPETVFHETMMDLIEMMKNMIEMFGPFLLQNLSLMLIYWLLHVYYVALVGISLFNTFNDNPDDRTMFLLGLLGLFGSLLILR